MKIAIIVEGETERMYLGHVLEHIKPMISIQPKVKFYVQNGTLPSEVKLKTLVQLILRDYDHVIALTDVYTGTGKRTFIDARDAKAKMKLWVGNEPRFHAHAAQYEIEAWLLPHWSELQKIANHNMQAPKGSPERVNHDKPPAKWIQELFHLGKRAKYSKTSDADRVLLRKGISEPIEKCLELKALVKTLLTICGGAPLG